MFPLWITGAILLLSLLCAGFIAWLLLRPYALHLRVRYRMNRIWMCLELNSGRKSLVTASMHNEGEQWYAGVRQGERSVWQQSWPLPVNRPWYPVLRRFWRLWNHPKRSAWVDMSWRLIREIWGQLCFRQAVTSLQMGLPSYAQTGYLAAAAYPLNFTLFRVPKLWRFQLLPAFSARGVVLENHVRWSFRGYQLLRPGYHFLNSPEMRRVLKRHFSKKMRRWGRRLMH